LHDTCATSQFTLTTSASFRAGDALIASGAWQLFDVLGLRPRVIPTARVSQGASVIYGGGGNLIPYYPDCAHFLSQCMRQAAAQTEIFCCGPVYRAEQAKPHRQTAARH
jgi:hypothetical protein